MPLLAALNPGWPRAADPSQHPWHDPHFPFFDPRVFGGSGRPHHRADDEEEVLETDLDLTVATLRATFP